MCTLYYVGTATVSVRCSHDLSLSWLILHVILIYRSLSLYISPSFIFLSLTLSISPSLRLSLSLTHSLPLSLSLLADSTHIYMSGQDSRAF